MSTFNDYPYGYYYNPYYNPYSNWTPNWTPYVDPTLAYYFFPTAAGATGPLDPATVDPPKEPQNVNELLKQHEDAAMAKLGEMPLVEQLIAYRYLFSTGVRYSDSYDKILRLVREEWKAKKP